MKTIGLLSLCLLALLPSLKAQTSFIEGCLGNWKGTMYIYSRGALKDSVSVTLTVAKTNEAAAWTWKTEYLSPKMPMVKDYVLRLKDAAKGHYITDEGGGIMLMDYLFNNKLYCVFETAGVMLTSTYELRGKELIFEVTSGKKQTEDNQPVTNFSVDNLQRVVFRKAE
ncbi:hypothetical protein [Runella slithyformis]|uniref:Lipocalin-like domain-containing protein n=1 Tax=Runella slithyformis (strain ATCC 29530 / DSM 19594 / LMG 11500 / NCIMB 11436 / LSU 4) TaxID=761193 RepID=A0A7U3ZKV5_RUNSL|nr:hypothetical protein [Runella slithyformis]AEI49080.1 hypothetical protein Runsl_2681 [Runella slithyformis DSM 19594]